VKTLKFSHDYEKLPLNWNGTQAQLMAVTPVSIDALKKRMPAFIDYDTKFRGKEGSYPLYFESGLILFFIHLNTGKPFTTIRRNYKQKFEYYQNAIDEPFKLLLVEEEAKTK